MCHLVDKASRVELVEPYARAAVVAKNWDAATVMTAVATGSSFMFRRTLAFGGCTTMA